MDFKDEIKRFGDRVEKLKNQILTEEATKNAFIMPLLDEDISINFLLKVM